MIFISFEGIDNAILTCLAWNMHWIIGTLKIVKSAQNE
jgi:hypothetical protein